MTLSPRRAASYRLSLRLLLSPARLRESLTTLQPQPSLRNATIAGAQVALALVLIAAALTALGQGLWDINLAYSLAIGLISWLSIDLLRLRWRESDDIPWPRGMRGMAVVPLGEQPPAR